MNSLKRYPIVLASVIILLNASAFAQNAKQTAVSPQPASIAAENAIKQDNSAKQQLQSFKHDPANPELSNLKLSLLELQVQLEREQSANQLSESEREGLMNRIKRLQSKIEAMNGVEPVQQNTHAPTQQNTRSVKAKEVEVLAAARESGNISREQFVMLSPAGRKEVLVNGVTITDLVNNNPETYKAANPNPLFIVASDFANYSIEKQIHILSHPQTYIVVQHASQIPGNNTEKQDPPLTKYKISKAELNQYSPERRKAIEASPDFIITD